MLARRFAALIQSEVATGRLPWRRHQKRTLLFCPRCRTRRPYQLCDGRWRCRRCRYTFGRFTGTWLGQARLPSTTWLWLIKLFELEVPALVAAQQAGVSYPTALRAFTVLRRAILAQAEPHLLELVGAEVEADESYFGGRRTGRRALGRRGRGSPGKVPVFGILERRGRVTVQVVHDVTAETLVGHTVRHVKRGALVYTDRYRGYDALAACGYRHLRVDHGRRQYGRGPVHINGLEGFWSYAKGKLAKHHGVAPHRFPLYLYEMQFRYNHRRHDLFDLLLDAVVTLVPDPL